MIPAVGPGVGSAVGIGAVGSIEGETVGSKVGHAAAEDSVNTSVDKAKVRNEALKIGESRHFKAIQLKQFQVPYFL